MQLTRREALKVGAAAVLLPSLPVKDSAKIDKREPYLPTGFAPFDEAAEGGMLPGEIMAVCSRDEQNTLIRLADYRTASDILIQRMRMRQPDLSRFWHQSLWVSWEMLAYDVHSGGVESWIKLAAKDGYKMVMMNTTYCQPYESYRIKHAALEHEIAVIFTRYTLRKYYTSTIRPTTDFLGEAFPPSDMYMWDHTLWVEPDRSGIEDDIKVPEFESRRCR